jgi:hypothetical protein
MQFWVVEQQNRVSAFPLQSFAFAACTTKAIAALAGCTFEGRWAIGDEIMPPDSGAGINAHGI